MSAASFLRRLFGRSQDALDPATRYLLSLCESLLGERGETLGAAIAREALAVYRTLDARGRERFFDVLAKDYSPLPQVVSDAAEAYRREPSADNLIRLQEAVDPARQELFRRLNMAQGGTAVILDMRRLILKGLDAHPQWRVIDADLRHLLRSWFNRGFLKLERIDWHTSAIVLEKLIEYEAVHAIQGWPDLRRRLESDRRCFAFFHPQVPDEPLIFIEVALTQGMSGSVQPLLDVAASVVSGAEADTAIFYSITNCQEGLRGISFGNLLIKQVAEELQRELPHVRTFATLSPIPGFRRWLDSARARLGAGDGGKERLALLEKIEDPAWHTGKIPERLTQLLLQACAWYLVNAKQGAEPLDAVARFHLGNGAALARLNWLGDTSPSGMKRAAGLMVNYVYRLADVERNHERYFRHHIVVASRAVTKLARECPIVVQPPASAQSPT
jgi:malonyl-CoA decarboxylase